MYLYNEIKKVLDNYEISNEEYKCIYDYLKCMNCEYNKTKELHTYDYEGYVTQLIGNKYSHYPAEDIAIVLYNNGEFKELIKEIYKGNIKVLNQLVKKN